MALEKVVVFRYLGFYFKKCSNVACTRIRKTMKYTIGTNMEFGEKIVWKKIWKEINVIWGFGRKFSDIFCINMEFEGVGKSLKSAGHIL